MRDIKFRAWDKHKDYWVFPVAVLADGRVAYSSEFSPLGTDQRLTDLQVSEDLEVVQYTGLKDKNGVEIYEGDIVIQPERNRTQMKVVEWQSPKTQRTGFNVGLNRGGDGTHLEVIGNIYENPELLS